MEIPACVETPAGTVLIDATSDGVTAVRFAHNSTMSPLDTRESHLGESHPLACQAAREIEEYLAGERTTFTVPLVLPEGDNFQARVQRALLDIPYGEAWTYSELAQHCDSKANRAVGTACAKNPLPILVPCHRVIRAGGSLGNYGGGVAFKQMLLALEGYTA